MVKHNIMAFNSVETLCKLHNIPYIFMQGIDPIENFKYPFLEGNHNISTLLESILTYEHLIDDNKFIGWPPDERLGGLNYNIIRDKYTKTVDEWHLIPWFDYHPNNTGHEYIAKYMYTGINEIYENIVDKN